MEDLSLLIDLHKDQNRQGPGSNAVTAMACQLAGLDDSRPLRIADIGCGTGVASLQLARALQAQVTAVDFLPEFIEVLSANAQREGLSEQVTPLVASMEALPFEENEYDVIWSEGAVYNMGFENGVRQWQRYLKPGGVLVVSEITWTSAERPQELQRYWDTHYPEVATAATKIGVLEAAGYSPTGYFVLPPNCWLEEYYRPIEASFADFLARNADDKNAGALVEAEQEEIAFYRKYQDYYSYGMYIARKPETHSQ